MITPKRGKDKILMFRLLRDAEAGAAAKLALQTSHEWNYSRATSSTATKDGSIVSQNELEVTLQIDAVTSDDSVNNMLKESVEDGLKLEVWEIDLGKPGTGDNEGKYAAKYAQGNLEDWTVPAAVEDFETLSTSMRIDHKPQDGWATLTSEQEEEIAYAFRDVTVLTPIDVAISSAVQQGGSAGSADSTSIKITFDKDVVGLTADHITLETGTGSATKGALTGSNKIWTLAISNPSEGNIGLKISGLSGYSFPTAATTVAIYASA